MKICIVGAGSVGGLIGARLVRAGYDVSLIARGAHLDALRDRGLTLEAEGRRETVPIAASDDPNTFGPQDTVIVAVKSPALPAVLPRLSPLLDADTMVVTAMNGIPWWFFDGFAHRFGDARPGCIDRDGRLAASVDMTRIVGCVIHLAASVPAPGVIRHAAADHLIVGEPDGTRSARNAGRRAAASRFSLRHQFRDPRRLLD